MRVTGETYEFTPTTRYYYNTFGEVSEEWVLVDRDRWAVTHNYYDQLGRKAAEINPNGYLTEYEYNEFGELRKASSVRGKSQFHTC